MLVKKAPGRSVMWKHIASNYGLPLPEHLLPYQHLSESFRMNYRDVIMGAMVSQITSLMAVYLTVYSGADQRKHQSSMSLAFVRGIHRSPVNSPHKGSVMWKMFPFDDIIMHFAWWQLFGEMHTLFIIKHVKITHVTTATISRNNN